MKKKQQIGGAAHLSLEGIRGATKLQSGDRVSVMIQRSAKKGKRASGAITLALVRPMPNRGTEALRFSQLISLLTGNVPTAGREDDKLVFPFDEPLVITDLIAMATGMALVPLTMRRPLMHLYELRRDKDAAEPVTALKVFDVVSFWGNGEQLAIRLPRPFVGSSDSHDVVFPAGFDDIPAVLDLLSAITGLLLVQRSSSPLTYDCWERKPD